MATYTSGLGVTLMEEKQKQPHLVFNDALNYLDTVLSGRLAKDLSSLSTYTATNAESLYTMINPYGTPSADFTFIVNGTQKIYLVINDSNKTCSFGKSTGTKVDILAGQRNLCYFDGTNMHNITDLDSLWTDLTAATGWTNSGGSWATISHRKIGNVVHLRGQVDSTTATTNRTITTLPTGFRPNVQKKFGELKITTGGVISYEGSTATQNQLSFDGLLFL